MYYPDKITFSVDGQSDELTDSSPYNNLCQVWLILVQTQYHEAVIDLSHMLFPCIITFKQNSKCILGLLIFLPLAHFRGQSTISKYL